MTEIDKAKAAIEAIETLQQLDKLSNELFARRVSPEVYRQKVAELIAGMDEATTRHFAATYVDEDEARSLIAH